MSAIKLTQMDDSDITRHQLLRDATDTIQDNISKQLQSNCRAIAKQLQVLQTVQSAPSLEAQRHSLHAVVNNTFNAHLHLPNNLKRPSQA